MSLLIRCPVRLDPPPPGEGFAVRGENDVVPHHDRLTRERVVEAIGAPVVRFPLPQGRTLLVRQPGPRSSRGLLANLKASLLCGTLVFGPALVVGPTDEVEWNPDGSEW